MKRITRRPAENNTDILIIGGGASGLAAACVALKAGSRVTVLEARDRVGRKLLATGNGRCNLMNLGAPVYFGEADFALEVLRHCPREEVTRFFEGLGLTLTREGDLVYPATLQAASVLDALRLPIAQHARADIRCGEDAAAIRPGPSGFTVLTKGGESFTAWRVIAAAGSPTQPNLSGSDSLGAPLRALGHQAVPFRPALTALLTDKGPLRGLKGLRIPAVCTLAGHGGAPAAVTQGEVLFAQDGVSGVCAMQLSRAAGTLLQQGRQPTLYLDLSPLMGLAPRAMGRLPQAAWQRPGASEPRVFQWLKERASAMEAAGLLADPGDMPRLLTGALPRQLLGRVAGLSMQDCARLLSAMPFPVTGLRGFDHAQVAAGGIRTGQVNPATMESLLVPGLYLTGELLNVDGDCGGHNLMFAWATGLLAGRAAARADEARDPRG